MAREALATDDAESHRQAVACLIEAVAALDTRLSELIAGKIEFTGDIVAPAFLHSGKSPQDNPQ